MKPKDIKVKSGIEGTREELVSEIIRLKREIEDEAAIEASLERVRARTMVMHKSAELSEVAALLFDELKLLGAKLWTAGFAICREDDIMVEKWMGSPILGQMFDPLFIPYQADHGEQKMYETWKKSIDLYSYVQDGKELSDIYEHLMSIPTFKANFQRVIDSGTPLPVWQKNHVASYKYGYLLIITTEEFADEHIFPRFAKVFEQTYTRFLDLQKAESQAHEAQIEASLERVRARSMAMHSSDELAEVSSLLNQEFQNLLSANFSAGFLIDYQESDDFQFWISREGKLSPDQQHIPYFEHPIFSRYVEAKQNKEEFYTLSLTPEDKNRWLDHAFTYIPDIDQDTKEYLYNAPGYNNVNILLNNAGLFVESFTGDSFSDRDIDVVKRFAAAFEQTYTRFLDLQNAELQAREAQIEVALERVRSVSMAMHESDELVKVATTVYQQLIGLGFDSVVSGGFNFPDAENKVTQCWFAETTNESLLQNFRIPFAGDKVLDERHEYREKGIPFLEQVLKREEVEKHMEFVFPNDDSSDEELAAREAMPDPTIFSIQFLNEGYMILISVTPLSEDQKSIMGRFANVFNSAYTRFLDLQKAEAQAREAQVQLALERIRARTIAMHSSDEFRETLGTLFEQLELLDFSIQQCALTIIDEGSKVCESWQSASVQSVLPKSFKIPFLESPIFQQMFDCWQLNRGGYSVTEFRGAEKRRFDDYIFTQTPIKNAPKEVQEFMRSHDKIVLCRAHMKYGFVETASNTVPLSDEKASILQRVANVIEQTYTRFLDLQKSEAQAREAQIQLGLERVRARAMAMQTTDELKELIGSVFTELTKLDLLLTRCIIMIYDPESRGCKWWMANSEEPSNPSGYFIKYHEQPPYLAYVKAWQERPAKWQYVLEGAEKVDWDEMIFKETELSNLPDYVIDGMKEPDRVYLTASFNNFGCLSVASLEALEEEHSDILLRFTKTFNLTYTRFKDLKLAEAQAREAQIETALERVRAKAMAMHNSKDVSDATTVMFAQLDQLGIQTIRCGVSLFDEETKSMEAWASTISANERLLQVAGKIDMTIHPLLESLYDGWKENLVEHRYDLQGEELKSYYHAIRAKSGFDLPVENLTQIQTANSFYFPDGALYSFTEKPLEGENAEIFRRFAKVFTLTYRRYLDLIKAEEQAREAQIEASLERVRAATMAMHKSEELLYAADVFSQELVTLAIPHFQSGFVLINETKSKQEVWMGVPGQEKSLKFLLPLKGDPILESRYESWKKQESIFHQQVAGEDLARHRVYVSRHFESTQALEISGKIPDAVIFYCGNFREGYLHIVSEVLLDEEQELILARFTKAFQQTYTRFLDLQKAEAQGRETIKQASLDRVRGEIASMRTTEDLNLITPLIWKELNTLGITFMRCGVFILDENQNKIHIYLSTPDGQAIAAFHTPLDDPGNLAIAIDHWHEQKMFATYWTEEDFKLQADQLVQHGAIATPDEYLNSLPQEGFHLHFSPFSQGMLYVGSLTPLKSEDLQTVQALTDSFSVAYARYEDFNKLEEAKKSVDATLTQLQSTQSQLIQSEKMASLGELTAGIAHEIQNPLNFVNNFSELNEELITELRAELEKGNLDEVKMILKDLFQNEEKINHHGRRAESIVKGMLLHSRSETGEKELSDINALCDEYLRLAYHGFRARDKSFNADFDLDLDPELPTIEIVPQEMGRVLLNLINNAFQAVSAEALAQESSQQSPASSSQSFEGDNYEPKVVVKTEYHPLVPASGGNKSEEFSPSGGGRGEVWIIILDNGPGIPEEIKDKIFQPFFTTKPTGQGTGLGLSLSYDIIKAHGGQISVHSEEGTGTTFLIKLPVS